MGLGYEISSVATPGLLSASNRIYVELVRQLGRDGVIRIGGNTSDYSAFSPHAASVSAPKATVINEQSLRDLASFLRATGWSMIWGLNLGGGSIDRAVEEARAVASTAGDGLLAFEIGNEPDLFVHEGHRQHFSYDDYLKSTGAIKQQFVLCCRRPCLPGRMRPLRQIGWNGLRPTKAMICGC